MITTVKYGNSKSSSWPRYSWTTKHSANSSYRVPRCGQSQKYCNYSWCISPDIPQQQHTNIILWPCSQCFKASRLSRCSLVFWPFDTMPSGVLASEHIKICRMYLRWNLVRLPLMRHAHAFHVTWRFGVVVMRWSQSTRLTYAEPG